MAAITGGIGQKLAVPAFHAFGLGIFKPSHQAVEQPFISRLTDAMRAPVYGVARFLCAIQDLVLLGLGEFVPGFVQGDLELMEYLAMVSGAGGLIILMDPADRLQGPVSQAQGFVWHHQIRIESHLGTQTITGFTHALRTVE